MTTAQRHIHESLETQRWLAQQAQRAQSRHVLQANALERAGELAQLGRFQESRRVLELNFFAPEED